jgi:hypothetical protein
MVNECRRLWVVRYRCRAHPAEASVRWRGPLKRAQRATQAAQQLALAVAAL